MCVWSVLTLCHVHPCCCIPCALALCCLQLDKAAADASEYKAGYDKVLADSADQKAQVCRG
jgi:hypothetical protein